MVIETKEEGKLKKEVIPNLEEEDIDPKLNR
jgi:hypothetical protein